MKITARAKVEITFSLTKAQMHFLMVASAHHYDWYCRSASSLGGFLFGWNNQFHLAENPLDTQQIEINWGELDTVSKILEMGVYANNKQVYNELSALAQKLRRVMSELGEAWRHEADI